MGFFNYYCKLLLFILVCYGMDKQIGWVKFFWDMNQGELFDCVLLGDCVFFIELEYVNMVGYGKDCFGSFLYLYDIFEDIKWVNKSQECFILVYVDGDGYCLVYVVFWVLVGWEFFWYVLRENFKQYF